MSETEKCSKETGCCEQKAIIAAIAMALSCYQGDNVHDEESGKLTIKYDSVHWNNLI